MKLAGALVYLVPWRRDVGTIVIGGPTGMGKTLQQRLLLFEAESRCEGGQ